MKSKDYFYIYVFILIVISLFLFLFILSNTVLKNKSIYEVEVSEASVNKYINIELNRITAEINPDLYITDEGVNEEMLFKNFGIKIDKENYVHLDSNNRLVNCYSDSYNFTINKDSLVKASSEDRIINLSEFISFESLDLINACQKYIK